jgi:hypothetical protein
MRTTKKEKNSNSEENKEYEEKSLLKMPTKMLQMI